MGRFHDTGGDCGLAWEEESFGVQFYGGSPFLWVLPQNPAGSHCETQRNLIMVQARGEEEEPLGTICRVFSKAKAMESKGYTPEIFFLHTILKP